MYLYGFPISKFLFVVDGVSCGGRLVYFDGRFQAESERGHGRRRDAKLRREGRGCGENVSYTFLIRNTYFSLQKI